MVSCTCCGKWRSGPRRIIDGRKYCIECALKTYPLRKQQVIDLLLGDRGTVELFKFEEVRTNCLCVSNALFLGRMVFTNKGICFLRVGQAKRSSTLLWFLLPTLCGLLIVGLIAVFIADEVNKSRLERAMFEMRLAFGVDISFAELLQLVPQVEFYPREEIRDVTINSTIITIKTCTGKWRYAHGANKHVYRELRPLVRAYGEAIRNGEEPRAGLMTQPPPRLPLPSGM